MFKNYSNLFYKIFVTLIFIFLFIKLLKCNNIPIKFGNSFINSIIWGIIILIGISIYIKFDKFIGTLFFILIIVYYKKFFKENFSNYEYYNTNIENFEQENKNLGNFIYAEDTQEIPYSLDKYPVDFEIATTNTFSARNRF